MRGDSPQTSHNHVSTKKNVDTTSRNQHTHRFVQTVRNQRLPSSLGTLLSVGPFLNLVVFAVGPSIVISLAIPLVTLIFCKVLTDGDRRDVFISPGIRKRSVCPRVSVNAPACHKKRMPIEISVVYTAMGLRLRFICLFYLLLLRQE